MKKLLLHIGYPKTATTTLQEEIFVTLHNQGKINYLGRTIQSTHVGTGRSNFDGVDWVWDLRRHYNIGKKLEYDNSVLKADILNLISDEDLTFHDFLNYAQFGKSHNHENLPQWLKNILGSDVEVSIVLTLRNQVDLIFSSYLQKLNFLKFFIGDYSFTDFLNNKYAYQDRDVKSHLSLYDFNYITNLWQTEFSSKINVMFFEDLSKDQETFFSELANLLPASSNELQKLGGKKNHRKRDKSNDYITVRYKSLSRFSRLITLFVNKRKFESFFKRRQQREFSLFLKFENRLLFKSVIMKVPKPTEKEQKFIKDMFHTSNIEFAKENDIDLKKMNKYNYIN
jgi:hypothetical protein